MARIESVIKRDGSLVPFNQEKIVFAVYRAAVAVGGRDKAEAEAVAHDAVARLSGGTSTSYSVEEIQDAVEKSLKNERLKTDLITNVSHDIKTPLTSIINYVDLLKRENFNDPKIKGYLDILEAKAQRLKTLTEDVVEASKVSSGNMVLEFMDVNLVEMINQTAGEFAEKFAAKNSATLNR